MSGCLRGVPRPGHWLEGGQASGGQATGCQATGGQAHRPVRGPGGGGRGGAHLGASQEEAGIGMQGQGAGGRNRVYRAKKSYVEPEPIAEIPLSSEPEPELRSDIQFHF